MSELLLLNAGIRNAREELVELKDMRKEMLKSARNAKTFGEWLECRADARSAKRDIAKVRREITALGRELERARSGEYERER
jgi:hypothetical protein